MALRDADNENRLDILISPAVIDLMRAADTRKFTARSHDVIVDAERIGARFASWYEIFPRSQSGDGVRHGTFQDVIDQLPRIAAMRFDVLYFPPIHPIGRINRKGRNNSLTPSENDPGSPYAIGSDCGGHDAIHPELGGIDDFLTLVKEASRFGLEIALDFAIQCAPDHPWLSEHKEWFDWRPDGSIRYAENPPKKYQDIVNVDFYAERAKPSLWLALRDVVQFWINQGIRLFRVDNPHTKPFPFWEWLIQDIRGRHPDTIFLAEAFTRPKVMYRLAKIGFSQSYTYFTWRNTKAELTAYIDELNQTAPRDFFRPHFFVNTPDINPAFLHESGRPGFLIRAALAATLSGLWGVYNGFELCEATPIAPGKEEYLDSEKYQLRAWDHDRPGNIIEEIAKLNSIRRGNAALQSHLGIQFHAAFDDEVLFFSKVADDGNVILAAICLDPFNTHQFKVELPLYLFNLPDTAALATTDLMRDFDFTWRGKIQDVTLHPQSPFCIWRIRPEGM
jgi:starch synthase (maltosyl-transferring)